jgi:Putative Flp pilus-assembly TadE/G-like
VTRYSKRLRNNEAGNRATHVYDSNQRLITGAVGCRRKSRRGFVVIAVGLSILFLVGVAGLAVDIGRMYIAKSEAQAFCDAAAVSAAVKLDGTASGITAAQTGVTDLFQLPWNFGLDKITTPQVEFATNAAGPWAASPITATGYTFARVRTNMAVTLYLLSGIARSRFGGVAASAVAAQVAMTSFKQGLAPYTAVSTDTTSSNLGFVVGNQYDIQWPQYNGSRSGCGPANPENCFNSPPCSGDPASSLIAVTRNWGASINGYWGSNQNSEIAAEVMDLVQLHPVAIGDAISLTSGNKNSEAGMLDQRVMQDSDVRDNTVSSYINSSNRNGRRLIALPVVNPTPGGTFVTGYGSFLLLSNATPGHDSDFYTKGTGNDPFCAVYVGPYVQGSISSGGASGAGAFRVSLVE